MDDKIAKETYDKLAAPFPEDAIQRTKGSETRRGYDTTGIAYQFVVNRLNEVAGLQGWNYSYEIIKELEGTFHSGGQFYDLTLEVSVWVGDPGVIRKAPGGHRAASYADALKGALTNGLKKAAAMFGVGRQAYEGTLDDDNVPHPAEDGRLKEMPKPPSEPIGKPQPKTATGSPERAFIPGQLYVGTLTALRPRMKQEGRQDSAGVISLETQQGMLTCYFFSRPDALKKEELDWATLIGQPAALSFVEKEDRTGATWRHVAKFQLASDVHREIQPGPAEEGV